MVCSEGWLKWPANECSDGVKDSEEKMFVENTV